MRIISGTKRGMTILSPKGNATRPITDRVKESIFDVLYKYNLIEGRLVADLFCGTGSFGLEVLSRGAKEAVFVDMDKRTIEILRKNIAKAGFVAQGRVVCANAFKVGAPPSYDGQKHSLVFVDPPYEMSRKTGLNSRLGGLLVLLTEQVTNDGLVIVRTEKKVNILDNYGDLKIIDRRIWSSMAVAFLALKKDDKQTGGNTDNSHPA
ncbi:MAG: RsmD family RNA methyltransferase [Sedimentisphaerales bacterium]